MTCMVMCILMSVPCGYTAVQANEVNSRCWAVRAHKVYNYNNLYLFLNIYVDDGGGMIAFVNMH